MYSDAEAAALYNLLNPRGTSDDVYLSLVMGSPTVLDVGCGTGIMLHRARSAGHTGRLAGVDPDRAALARARQRNDIEWNEGTAASMTWDGEFELAVMMNHGFQYFVTDVDLRTSLGAIHCSLIDGGCFVFETRNPQVREWEDWHSDNPIDVVDPSGRPVRITYDVQSVDEDVVAFSETTSDPDGTILRVDHARFRFLGIDRLSRFLADTGCAIDNQPGGWAGEAVQETSQEIVTYARKT
ncbi:MAG: class I SAM-dependent methyltransferase [Chloroflexia bacterium]|nr:class I SAM-dependent methyltransferase [Chloroflexia bacterium]